MPSEKQSPLEDLYAGWTAAMASRHDMPLQALRGMFEHWGDVTGEPGAVDYTEVDVGGLEALWLTPKKSVKEPEILCACEGRRRRRHTGSGA